MATYGPYGSTKFALEAVSDSLRTAIGDKAIDKGPKIGVDHETRTKGTLQWAHARHYRQQVESAMKSALPAEAAARVIAKAVTARKPRTRYTVGLQTAIMTYGWCVSCPRQDARTFYLRQFCVPLFSDGEQMSAWTRLNAE